MLHDQFAIRVRAWCIKNHRTPTNASRALDLTSNYISRSLGPEKVPFHPALLKAMGYKVEVEMNYIQVITDYTELERLELVQATRLLRTLSEERGEEGVFDEVKRLENELVDLKRLQKQE